MKKSMVALFVLIFFTNVVMCSAESDESSSSYFRSKYIASKAKTRRVEAKFYDARQAIALLKAEKAELNQWRLAASNERTLAMVLLIQAQSELTIERVRLKAAEDEIARLQSLISK